MEGPHPKSSKQNCTGNWYSKAFETFSSPKYSKNIVLQSHTPPLKLWDNSLGQKTQAYQQTTKWAVRQVTNAKYNSHTEPIMKRLKLLKVNDLYNLAALKLFHKYENNDLPSYFTNIFASQIAPHEYNTRHKNSSHQKSNTISASHSPRYCVPRVVETIPDYLTSTVKMVKLPTFSNTTKKYFISNYKYSCPIYNCYICNNI